MKTVGEIIPSVPPIGHRMPCDQIAEYRRKYPEVLGAVLMACVAKQARLIAEIFHDQYTVIDDDIFSACYTLARCGYTPDVLVGSKDEHALGLFNLCVNAANDARTLRAKLEEAQAD